MYINCKLISKKIEEDVKRRIEELGFSPKLISITSKSDYPTLSYLEAQRKRSKKLGIEFDIIEISPEKLPKIVEKISADKNVHGILVTRPLPEGINEFDVLSKIDPSKDIEGVTPYNLGLLVYGKEIFPPCTAESIIRILESESTISGKKIVIIGRSVTVGKPLAIMLLRKGRDATVTVCHSKTKNLFDITRQSEILIVAVGKASFIKPEHVREEAIVVDVGINFVDGKIIGDVDSEVEKIAKLTPVPGGVGKVTTMLLMEHVVKSAEMSVYGRNEIGF
ncbi:MAG TPA: bifunctional 5,10-methylenetetrahydrofolate dehydrogenase/5,10-methenyltetrahydrofolate cyclohydrolase [Thermotoga sp.]|nr:bifunctional 5,10-methylenetetrahydrofolate dehydrogenase/5,10-methenyltetrahydrofolate cyclohydrolase [Thermotoga sp.]